MKLGSLFSSLCVPCLFVTNAVAASACPHGSGQKWNDCGQDCTPTCGNPFPICTDGCVPRCECPDQKPILHEGKCVKRDNCPQCPGNQVYTDCGSACTATCDDPNPVCTEQCVARCECPDFYTILREDGWCIHPDQCPPVDCPNNLQWNFCGSDCTPTCDDPDPVCSPGCVERCECPYEAPYYDEMDDKCISKCKGKP